MRYLGAATEAVPFWQRLSAFFRYPFHWDPLLVVAFCTLVPIFLGQGILGWVTYVVLALVLFKYTYAVIRYTAEGHMKPPPVAAAWSGDGFAIGIQQMVVFIAMVLLVGFAMALLGPIPGLVVGALVVLALPASIMVLAMENSVFAALNPLNLTTLITAIGWPYFLLYGFLILMTMASGAAQDFAVSHLDPEIAQPLSGFLSSTYMLILFHMLGYLLFQYQQELGFASDYQDDEAPADPQRDRSRRIDADIDMNLKEGNYDRVAGILEESLIRDPANPTRLEQLYRLSLARNDREALKRHHGKLLHWMVALRRHREMKSLLALLRQQDAEFQPADPELVVACADLLFLQSEPKPALQLLKDFHKRFPESDQVAPACILVARILANDFRQWHKAARFLRFARQHTRDPGLTKTIDHYLGLAQREEPLRAPRASFAPMAE
nr:hypothetical protein [Marinobacter bryozoorum]